MESYYEYYENEVIEKSLVCDACQKPFSQPVTTPSGEIFCRQCAEAMMIKGKDLIPLTDATVLDALEKLMVRCTLCNEGNIVRGDFENHVISRCPKAVVTCSAGENDCSWLGLREELPIHWDVCSHRPARKISSDGPTQDLVGKFFPICDINFQERQFRGQDTATAVKALLINKRLTCLDLFTQSISSNGALTIASVLHNDLHLETLSLRNNCVCDSGVQFLAQALATNSHLKRLDLNGNAITDIGVRLLTEMLKSNGSLIKLTLSFNRITNEGLQLLIDALIDHNATLQWLCLTGNDGIDGSCIHMISHFMRHNRALRTLNLEACNLSRWDKKQIHLRQKIYFKSGVNILL